MSRLTEDLLTLARVESGETRFETEPVPPIELLRDAEESFRAVARGQGVDLQIMGLQEMDLQETEIVDSPHPSKPCRRCAPTARPSTRSSPISSTTP